MKKVYFSSIIQFMSFPTIVIVCRVLEFYNLRITIMVISFKSPFYTVLANFFALSFLRRSKPEKSKLT